MEKAHNLMEITEDSREYKMAMRDILTNCPLCKPHRGCNRKHHREDWRSWKNYRKTQYKCRG